MPPKKRPPRFCGNRYGNNNPNNLRLQYGFENFIFDSRDSGDYFGVFCVVVLAPAFGADDYDYALGCSKRAF